MPVRVERTRTFLCPGDEGGFDADPTSVRLLPQYDAYVIGFRPREQLFGERVKQRVAEDPKGRYESVTGMSPVLVDGVVTGFWRRDGAVERVVPLPRGRKRGEFPFERAAGVEEFSRPIASHPAIKRFDMLGLFHVAERHLV